MQQDISPVARVSKGEMTPRSCPPMGLRPTGDSLGAGVLSAGVPAPEIIGPAPPPRNPGRPLRNSVSR